MLLFNPACHPFPNLSKTRPIALLPIDQAVDGPLFDRQTPCDHNDQLYADWDAPLVWHHQKSQVKSSTKFKGKRAIHFAFEDRVPKDVWDKNWTLWYDHALLWRRRCPADVLLTGSFAMEEVATGLGSDNVEKAGSWVGIVARMQDLRRYYFLTLEFPGRVVLYRRDDHQWLEVAHAQVHLDVFTEYRLTLQCKGSDFHAWINEHFLFAATDYGHPGGGYCGVRASCVGFITDFAIHHSDNHSDAIKAPPPPDDQPAGPLQTLPTPIIAHDFDLTELGPLSKTPRHHATLRLLPASPSASSRLLVKCFDHPEEATHAVVDMAGNVQWTIKLPGGDMIHLPPPGADGAQDIIVIGQEMTLLDAATGQIKHQASLPPLPPSQPGARPEHIAPGNGPHMLADLDGDGIADTFFLTCGAERRHLWAVDFGLNVRWYVRTPSGQGHGGHLAVCDVDKDGREEILAGCALISPDGEIRWVQEEIMRRLGCPNGGHIDSAQAGYFDGPDQPPTWHVQGSSSGHLVVNAATGKMLAVHPQGHVQSGTAGWVVPGDEAVQIISSNRWGSYGVTGIYSGQGRRLSRFQPGFTCQSASPINWTGTAPEHLLVCDGQGYRGIYSWRGERLFDLEPWIPYSSDPFSQRYDRVNTLNTPIVQPYADDLLIRIGNRIRVLTAERPVAAGNRAYTPRRQANISWPAWTTTK